MKVNYPTQLNRTGKTNTAKNNNNKSRIIKTVNISVKWNGSSLISIPLWPFITLALSTVHPGKAGQCPTSQVGTLNVIIHLASPLGWTTHDSFMVTHHLCVFDGLTGRSAPASGFLPKAQITINTWHDDTWFLLTLLETLPPQHCKEVFTTTTPMTHENTSYIACHRLLCQPMLGVGYILHHFTPPAPNSSMIQHYQD